MSTRTQAHTCTEKSEGATQGRRDASVPAGHWSPPTDTWKVMVRPQRKQCLSPKHGGSGAAIFSHVGVVNLISVIKMK